MITIKNLSVRNLNGRQVVFAQAFKGEERVQVGQLSHIMLEARKHNIEVSNSDELLKVLVLDYGFTA